MHVHTHTKTLPRSLEIGIPVTPFAPSARYPLAHDSLLSASLPCLLDALEAQPDVRPFLNSIFPIAAYFQLALSAPCSDAAQLAAAAAGSG